jgi:hypothetical protein
LINKYIPIALNCVFEEYESQSTVKQEGEGKGIENTAIEEVWEEQLESDGEESPQPSLLKNKKEASQEEEKHLELQNGNSEEKPQFNPFLEENPGEGTEKRDKNTREEDLPIEEEEKLGFSEIDSFVDLGASKNTILSNGKKEHEENEDTISMASSEFSILTTSDLKSLASIKTTKSEKKKKKEVKVDLEHLSNIDPEDEWLQCETGSIVDSIMTGEHSNAISDYSVIDNIHSFAMSSASIVNTKRDIYAEDIVMQKIITYISYFSNEIKDKLEHQRSSAALILKTKEKKQSN